MGKAVAFLNVLFLFSGTLQALAADLVPEPPDSSTPAAFSSPGFPGTGAPLLPGTTAAASTAAKPSFTLHGGVTHSEALPHVSETIDNHRQRVKITDTGKLDTTTSNTATATDPLQGNLSDKNQRGYLPMQGIAQPQHEPATKNLSAEVHKATTEWFMIPAWMAGKWVKQGDLTVSTTDLRTGQQSYHNTWVDNHMEANWGHQADSAGNIWHVNFLPSERDGQSDGKLVRFLTVVQKCEKSNPQMLMTRTQYVVSESNFYTGRPVEMFQQESLNHYALSNPTLFINNSTNRVFTYEGSPVRDGHLQSQYTKLGGFNPVATINGVDLKSSLNDYLESHGMANLMTKQ